MNSRDYAAGSILRSLLQSQLLIPLVAIAAMAMILFSNHPAPLFSDYVEWTYHGVLLRDWLQGHPDSAYLLKNYPVPNSLTTIGLGLLMLVMPWAVATKLWLLIEVLLGLWCAYKLRRATGGGQSWQLAVIAAGALLGINLWCGFSNFQFGTYFAMLFCALLIEGVQSRWLYGALLVVLFFSHMIPFGFAIVAFFLYAHQTRRWRILWQTVPTFLLCFWYFAGRLIHRDVDGMGVMHSSVRYASPAFIAYRINTYLKCWGFVNIASTVHDSILLKLVGVKLFVILFGLATFIGIAVLIAAIQVLKHHFGRDDPQRFLWLTVSLFFLVGLIMPEAAAGISDPGGRMVQLASWCALCAITIRGRWIGGMLSGSAAVLLFVSLYQMAVVAERPPTVGATGGPLPARLRQFAHVLYINRGGDYDNITRGQMNAPIYPTAMFIQRSRP